MRRRALLVSGSACLIAASVGSGLAQESPANHGAVGDGVTDDGPAFIAAQDAALQSGNNLVVVEGGIYKIDTAVPVLDGIAWVFNGVTLKTSRLVGNILHASGTAGWSISGRLTLEGDRTAQSQAFSAQHGLVVENCDDYIVDGVTARNLRGFGFWVTGSTATGRGGRQFVACSAKNCRNGRRLEAGGGGEYTSWSNWTAEKNYIGDSIAAGNTMTSGGAIANNLGGVELSSGANHGHGIYSGVSINHNSVYNVEAIGVINGFTFSGCHFYENQVILRGCRGVFVRGGIFDCKVINDGTSTSGENGVTDCFMPGDYFPAPTVGTTAADNGLGLSQFSFQRCSGPGAS